MEREQQNLDTINHNRISSVRATPRSHRGQPNTAESAMIRSGGPLQHNTPVPSGGEKLLTPVPSVGKPKHAERVSMSQPADLLILRGQREHKPHVQIRPVTQAETTQQREPVPPLTRSRTWHEKPTGQKGQFPAISDHMIHSPLDHNMTGGGNPKDTQSIAGSQLKTENPPPEGVSDIRTRLQEAGIIPGVTGSTLRKGPPPRRKSFSTADTLRSKTQEISNKMNRYLAE